MPTRLFHGKEARHWDDRGANHLSRHQQSRCGRRLLEGPATRGEDIATVLRHRLGLGVAGRTPAFWVCQAHQVLQLGGDLVWALTTDGYMSEEGSVQVAECPKYTPRFISHVSCDFHPHSNFRRGSITMTVASTSRCSLVDGKASDTRTHSSLYLSPRQSCK